MKWLRRAPWLIAASMAAVGGWLFFAGHRGALTAPLAGAMAKNPELIARGEYLTRAGDCGSCHTEPGGPPFAGGRLLPTPFGSIATPNLTPDRSTGLGGWTFEAFWRALHEGVGRHGELLYPAFPYTSFTRITRADARAVFAYLQSLAPVHRSRQPLGLGFPYNLRRGLAVWRAVYFKPGVFRPDPSRSAQWNRGAYLVQGPGHCSACHTAHGAWGGTIGAPLSGVRMVAQDWYAPGLGTRVHGGLQGWSTQDIVDLLKTGQSAKGSAFGPMAEVVARSTQYLRDDDLHAIAVYLQSLPPQQARMSAVDVPGAAASNRRGRRIYAAQCADCHSADGQGVAGVYPPLDGNSAILGPSGVNAIRAVLLGGFPPATAGNPRPYSMPPYAQQLDDADVAAVVSYIRTAWSNHAEAVSQADVFRNRHSPTE